MAERTELEELRRQQDLLQERIYAAEARIRESQSPARSEQPTCGGYTVGQRVVEDEMQAREVGFDPSPRRGVYERQQVSPEHSVVSDFTGRVICASLSPGVSTAPILTPNQSTTQVNERRPTQTRSGLWDKGGAKGETSPPRSTLRPSPYTQRPVPPPFS